MNHSRLATAALLSLLISVFVVDPASAQDQRGTGFVFTLEAASARALGMGGTFIGFADDATAADRNPAGIAQLQEPELWANLTFADFENEALVDFSGERETFTDDHVTPSFIGYVHPVGDGAFAVYYRRTKNVLSNSTFADDERPITFVGFDFLVEEEIGIDSTIQTFGGSAAYRFGDYVSVGGSVGLSNLDWSQSRSLTLTEAESSPQAGVVLDITHEDVGSSDLSFSGGVLFNPGGEVSGGLVYRRGPEFQIERRLDPSCFGGFGGALCSADNFTVDRRDLAVPSIFGAGISFRAEGLALGADVLNVSYSDLADSFEFLFGFPSDEPIDDEVVVRAGGEYEMGSEDLVGAVRAGIFTDPDHDGLADIDTDQVHFTFGGGVGVGQAFRVDAAVNLADNVTEFMISLGARFR